MRNATSSVWHRLLVAADGAPPDASGPDVYLTKEVIARMPMLLHAHVQPEVVRVRALSYAVKQPLVCVNVQLLVSRSMSTRLRLMSGRGVRVRGRARRHIMLWRFRRPGEGGGNGAKSDRVRVRDGCATVSGPVGVKKLAAGPVDAFIGVGAEVVALRLQQVCRQVRRAVAVVVGEC